MLPTIVKCRYMQLKFKPHSWWQNKHSRLIIKNTVHIFMLAQFLIELDFGTHVARLLVLKLEILLVLY